MTRGGTQPFYGWWIVGAAFLTLFTTVGIGLYVPPVFLVPLQAHFGWSRAAIAAGTAIAALIAAFASPLAGSWIDKYGSRTVMTGGTLVMGVSFTLLGSMDSLWQLYLLNGLAAFGLTCAAWVPSQTLISSWFERKRGMAMGLAMTGIGFGGLVMAPFAGWLIARYGWRVAFTTMGFLILVLVVPAVLLLVRSRPADLGLLPDGEPPPTTDRTTIPGSAPPEPKRADGIELAVALRSGAFWILSLCQFLSAFAGLSVIGHMVAFLTDSGLTEQAAAGALGVTIGISVGGRLLFGFLADRLTKHRIMALALAGHSLGILFLFSIPTAGALPVFVLIYGLSVGGAAVLVPLLIGECFGLLAFGKILGLIMISATLGAATGPILTGRIYDVSGSYQLAFVLHITAFLLAAGAMWFLSRPRAMEA